jgi:hypothetical protein
MPIDPSSGSTLRWGFLKVFVVVCSVLLVGGYIFYRGGGALLPGSKSARVAPLQLEDDPDVAAAAPIAKPATQPDRRMFPGSKSAVVIEARDLAPTSQPAERQSR